MRVSIGSDHRGIELKSKLIEFLTAAKHEVSDLGAVDCNESVDYPDFAEAVGQGVASGDCDRGILVCGTGIGMSISANKIPGVRAALCHDSSSAKMSRQHNDSNVLCLAENIDQAVMLQLLETWLEAEFEGGRHSRRVEKIRTLEEKYASQR